MVKMAWMAALLVAVAGAVQAVDYPLAVGVLRLEDPPTGPAGRRFRFRISKQAAIHAAAIPDPTVAGATLEVSGSGAGDGSSGVQILPAANWRALHNGGYYYRDHSASNGVSQVRIAPRGQVSGYVHMSGRSANWQYAVTQPQTAVRIRLTIGGDVYCAEATDLQPNRAGIAYAKANPAPAACN